MAIHLYTLDHTETYTFVRSRELDGTFLDHFGLVIVDLQLCVVQPDDTIASQPQHVRVLQPHPAVKSYRKRMQPSYNPSSCSVSITKSHFLSAQNSLAASHLALFIPHALTSDRYAFVILLLCFGG